MGIAFRHSAGFGKRMEYNLVGKMLMEGLDVYLPLVDDHGVDCVIKKEDGTFIEVQIKARSSEVTDGDAALFAAITHELTPNFYFVFYSERLDLMWIAQSFDHADKGFVDNRFLLPNHTINVGRRRLDLLCQLGLRRPSFDAHDFYINLHIVFDHDPRSFDSRMIVTHKRQFIIAYLCLNFQPF